MNDTSELSCRELVELVTDYLEGALDASEQARFEEHLAICEGCRSYLEQMRTTIAVTGSVDDSALEPGALDRLLAAFRDWKQAPG
jgi:predicted anti-sigma-YlaC factor YlaD